MRPHYRHANSVKRLFHSIFASVGARLGLIEMFRPRLRMGVAQPALAIALAVDLPIAIAAAVFFSTVVIAATAFSRRELIIGQVPRPPVGVG